MMNLAGKVLQEERSMEEEKEFVIPDGSLYYTVSESGVLVTRFQGTAARVTVPLFF